MTTIILDEKAKDYINGAKKLYKFMKERDFSERDIVDNFIKENEAVFHDTTSHHRLDFKHAIEDVKGRDTYYNSLLIYDIATGFLNVEYKKY